MITRRKFVIGLGIGAIAPQKLVALTNHLDQFSGPLLERVDEAVTKIFAIDWGGDGIYQLQLDTAEDEIPSFEFMTVREFADQYMGGYEYEKQDFDDSEQEATDYVNEYFAVEHWLREHSASARAYSYLYSIQFELEDSDTDEAGWIDFVDGPYPGNDSRWVEADALGLSMIQSILNRQGYAAEILMG